MTNRTLVLVASMIAIALAVVVGVVVYEIHVRQSGQSAFLTVPTTPGKPEQSPQSQPASVTRSVEPKDEKPSLKTYMDVMRASYPSLRTTQPLAVPLDLSQAARFVLKDPIYLGKSRGDLWITRPDAPPLKQVLHDAIDPNASDPQTHVLQQRVAFVHWMPTESGPWPPYLFCQMSDGGSEVSWAKDHKSLPSRRDFRWDRAFSWNEDVVVPSRTGVSIFHFGSQITESYRQLVADDALSVGEPQVLLDWKGVLAWAPWEHGATGSRGAFRYVDGKWTPLGSEQGWPQKLAYLVPLHDGSVFQFVQGPGDAITIQSTSLDQPAVDERAIRQLVAQLNDIDQDVRRKAFADLANYGPGAWPVMEKLLGNQPPQAKVLLAQLLKDKNRPTLSGMTLLGNRSLTLINRLSDGGVVFYAEQGVSVPESDEQETTTAPAWLSIRPGHYIELLPAAMVVDLKVGACAFEVVGEQWIINSDARGPRLFYGNGTATLLRKDELQFSRPIGMDQLGRWLFQQSNPVAGGPPQTLIIDPHLPDPTPRLPAWQLAIAEVVGWDKDNWPVIQNGAAYALMDADWRGMEKDEKVFTRLDQIPPDTMPATQAATMPTTDPSDTPILVTPDRTRYYDGLTELRVVQADGKKIVWPLPDIAKGAGPAWLIRDHNGKLFLFNQPGRVLRIAPTPGDSGPFKLEATFTRNIPTTSNPTRIWLDPAGRIDIVWGSRLAVLFPDGYIPRPIMEKIVDRSGLDAEGL